MPHPPTRSPFVRHEHCITRHLYKFLLSRVDTPFAYGKNDCCMFAADAVLSMTGVDVAAEFRGTYQSGAGAVRAIIKATGKNTVSDLMEWIAAKHGFNPLPGPLYAQRGDVVLCNYSDGEGDTQFLGIVAISGWEIAIPGAKGLMHLHIDTAVKGWKV